VGSGEGWAFVGVDSVVFTGGVGGLGASVVWCGGENVVGRGVGSGMVAWRPEWIDLWRCAVRVVWAAVSFSLIGVASWGSGGGIAGGKAGWCSEGEASAGFLPWP